MGVASLYPFGWITKIAKIVENNLNSCPLHTEKGIAKISSINYQIVFQRQIFKGVAKNKLIIISCLMYTMVPLWVVLISVSLV